MLNILDEIIENIVGVIFLILGIVFLVFGENAYDLVGLVLMSFGTGIIVGYKINNFHKLS